MVFVGMEVKQPSSLIILDCKSEVGKKIRIKMMLKLDEKYIRE